MPLKKYRNEKSLKEDFKYLKPILQMRTRPNKKRIDMLRDMEGIAVKIQKMQSGSENLAGINMAHFNIDEFIEIIEQKLNVKPLLINDYFKELSRIEQLRVKYNNERYMLEFNEFLNKYALQPKIDMEYQIFVMQYQNYLKDNVWLDSDN
ncbi:hypothetical protein [Acinetobacter sp. BSP-53]|uniref:hypothetical protein n=1 Tax=Acinetobacter sp. BSP-53 TaxID=3344662 RepID=UPI00376F6A24